MRFFTIIFLVIMSLISAYGFWLENTVMVIPKTGDWIVVSKADTEEEITKGLMGVESMPSWKGMLFSFDKSRVLSFWMKDTLIDLDIIFLDKDYRVVSTQSMKPCSSPPCQVYYSQGKAKRALEVNQGLVNSWGLQPNDRILPLGEWLWAKLSW